MKTKHVKTGEKFSKKKFRRLSKSELKKINGGGKVHGGLEQDPGARTKQT